MPLPRSTMLHAMHQCMAVSWLCTLLESLMRLIDMGFSFSSSLRVMLEAMGPRLLVAMAINLFIRTVVRLNVREAAIGCGRRELVALVMG
jgi:hypothetical protein